MILREKNLSPGGRSTGRDREEMTDISEVIRAAQDGDVMADFVLQVNELSVQHFSGTRLPLSSREEIKAFLERNPGLRLGTGAGSTIPSSLRQPWAQARFNAKLIDVKTGSIDWIGEYSIESLSVLEKGITIKIGVRRRVSNANVVTGAIQDHNKRVDRAYARAASARKSLMRVYDEVMQSYPIEGGSEEVERAQNLRRSTVASAERKFQEALEAYREVEGDRPRASRLDWEYTYDVDTPVVTPDLLNPRTEEEGQRLLEHVRKLGSKVTQELLRTIEMSEK